VSASFLKFFGFLHASIHISRYLLRGICLLCRKLFVLFLLFPLVFILLVVALVFTVFFLVLLLFKRLLECYSTFENVMHIFHI
jgi:hypothetical protein